MESSIFLEFIPKWNFIPKIEVCLPQFPPSPPHRDGPDFVERFAERLWCAREVAVRRDGLGTGWPCHLASYIYIHVYIIIYIHLFIIISIFTDIKYRYGL